MSTQRIHANPAHNLPDRCARWTIDAAITYSGNAYRKAGRSKAVAAAHDLSISRGVRYREGDKSSPLAKAFLLLATYPRTTAFPALVEAMALVTQVEIETADDATLARRRAELETGEHDLERDENRATYLHDDAACISAHAAKAAAHLELLAIVREQVRRKAGR